MAIIFHKKLKLIKGHTLTKGMIIGVLLLLAFGYLGQNIALKYVEPTKLSIIVSLEAVFASILKIIILSVVFKPFVFIGGSLIIAAVVVSQQQNNIDVKEISSNGKESI